MSSSSKWTPPAAASDPIILAAMIQSAKAVKIPDDEKHPDWARPTIKALVSAQGRPEAFEPVWATVLPFWRLKGLEERLEEDKELRDPWAMHALAWLVSRVATFRCGGREGLNRRVCRLVIGTCAVVLGSRLCS